MAYTVDIKKTSTGEIRTAKFDEQWHDINVYLWTEGNYSCDCNRHDFFVCRGYRRHPHVGDSICGDSEYRVLKAVLDDGTEIVLDGDEPDRAAE